MSISKGTHFTTRTYYKLIQNTKKLVQTTNDISVQSTRNEQNFNIILSQLSSVYWDFFPGISQCVTPADASSNQSRPNEMLLKSIHSM